MEFSFPIRVYYEDTDAGGIVYYGNYLKFFERARTEWLRNLGIEQQTWLQHKIGFVVRRVNMDNSAPAKLDDQLEVTVRVNQIKKASLTFEQTITNNKQVVASAQVTVACVHLDKMKPVAIPVEILGVITGAR